MPATPEASTAGTVLGFDFGLARIGVAVGETTLGVAHPLTAIVGEANAARFAAIAALIREWQPTLLVVGLPRRMDGSEHEMSARCRRFAHQLEGRFRLPVVLVDERLSSSEAEALLRESGQRGRDFRENKALLDQVAAQRILQSYFDQHATA